MLKLVKFSALALMLLQCLNCLMAENKFKNSNKTATEMEHMSSLRQSKPAAIEPATNEDNNSRSTKMEVDLSPLTLNDTPSASTNRTGRQLFYSPSLFFAHNYGNEGSKCITAKGLEGMCLTFDKCIQIKRHKRQLLVYEIRAWPLQVLPYFKQQQQQQQEFCIFYDQYLQTKYGICCTGIPNLTPIKPSKSEVEVLNSKMPAEDTTNAPECTEDSEVLEADLSGYQPEISEPVNINQDGNNIGYDPIEDLKQAAFYNNYNNYIHFPWALQFAGYPGAQQWPPPLPTHHPSLANWPPPLPTHPPNHHYPTHPPVFGGGSHFNPAITTTKNPIFATTSRKPAYPNYPTYRPTTTTTVKTTITTSTTTTRKPTTVGDTFASAGLGLPLQCGLRNAVDPDQERIVGGINASPHEFPWMVVLFKSGKQFCGGTLITNNHILTAAHCVARMTSWDVAALTAHLGDYNIRTDYEVKHLTRRIKRLVRHKGFDFRTLHNDIAILTLNEPVQFTHEIQPICLPTSTDQQSRSYSGHIGTVVGWGSLQENGPQPSILQKVQIPIWANAECARKYGRAAPAGIIQSMICAGQIAKDSCSGDSGGPLVVNEGSRYYQVGIVSWGIGCGQGQYPGVYTRVTSLLPWIYKNIK